MGSEGGGEIGGVELGAAMVARAEAGHAGPALLRRVGTGEIVVVEETVNVRLAEACAGIEAERAFVVVQILELARCAEGIVAEVGGRDVAKQRLGGRGPGTLRNHAAREHAAVSELGG